MFAQGTVVKARGLRGTAVVKEVVKDEQGSVTAYKLSFGKKGTGKSVEVAAINVFIPAPPPKGRNQRWQDAAADGRSACETLEEMQQHAEDADWKSEDFDRQAALDAIGQIEEAASTLAELKSEFEDWHGNMPDGLRDNSPVGEKLQNIVDLDVEAQAPDSPPEDASEIKEWLEELDVSDAKQIFEEAENADLPLGFGRD